MLTPRAHDGGWGKGNSAEKCQQVHVEGEIELMQQMVKTTG